MKKYRLTNFGKIILTLLIAVIVFIICYERGKELRKITRDCDKNSEKTCSFYEIRKKMIYE